MLRIRAPSLGETVASGSNDITGTAALTFAPSATVTGTGALTGSSALALASAATLTGTGDLTGTTTLTFDATGSISGPVDVTGSSSLTFAATGTLSEANATRLTGRKIPRPRGRRIIYPDELPPVEVVAHVEAPVIARPSIKALVAATDAALAKVARLEVQVAERKQARIIEQLQADYRAALVDLEQARLAEHIARLRAEDEFLLLAA